MPTAIETYLGSKELKKLIVRRSEELGLPLRFICLDLGIDYAAFARQYLNSNENKEFTIDEKLFEKLLLSLGVEIRHQFVIDKNFNSEEKKEYLRTIYEKHSKK